MMPLNGELIGLAGNCPSQAVSASRPHMNAFCVFFNDLISCFPELEYHSPACELRKKIETTSNGGSLGSWIDEERSQVR